MLEKIINATINELIKNYPDIKIALFNISDELMIETFNRHQFLFNKRCHYVIYRDKRDFNFDVFQNKVLKYFSGHRSYPFYLNNYKPKQYYEFQSESTDYQFWCLFHKLDEEDFKLESLKEYLFIGKDNHQLYDYILYEENGEVKSVGDLEFFYSKQNFKKSVPIDSELEKFLNSLNITELEFLIEFLENKSKDF